MLDAIESAQVVIVAPVLEREQRRVFQREQGEPGEESSGEGNRLGRRHRRGELLELVVEELNEGIAREVFPGGDLGGSHVGHLIFVHVDKKTDIRAGFTNGSGGMCLLIRAFRGCGNCCRGGRSHHDA